MAVETIFQNWIFTKFILPFALIVALVYGILEKTKLLGDGKHQLNAIIAFVIGITFTGFLAGTQIVSNMVLFLSVALVILFVILMLWGFIFGEKEAGKGFILEPWMKYSLGGVAAIAFIGAVIWATGFWDNINGLLFQQSWSNAFWTNFLFAAVVVISMVLILKPKNKK